MSTGCVRSPPDTAEDRLTAQDQLYEISDAPGTPLKDGGEMEKHCSEENQNLKKPRRKDTPVLNVPPLIPGVRVMKGESRLIHLEDEEKEGKK